VNLFLLTVTTVETGTGQAMWSISWEAVVMSRRPEEQDTANVNIDVVAPGETAVDSVHVEEASEAGIEMTDKRADANKA
jgi:hypothetical protein